MSTIEQAISKLEANSKEAFEEATRLLIKIADNILKFSKVDKIRILQKNNPTITRKILDINGGLECLKIMGFEENDTHFSLPLTASLETLKIVRDKISRCSSDSLIKTEAEPNMFSGLLTNSFSNHSGDFHTINPGVVPPPNTPSLGENTSTESETDSDPELTRAVASVSILNRRKIFVMPKIPLDVPRMNLPRLNHTYTDPFLKGIEKSFNFSLVFADKELRERAKQIIPIYKLETAALNRLRAFQRKLKKGQIEDTNFSLQDFLLLELLSWFKNDFFTWVNMLDCYHCGGRTAYAGLTTDPKLTIHTNNVEIHQCEECKKSTYFPRYSDPNMLLISRCGRCGEWAITFTLLCVAMGWDARYIVDQGDHVWTEVYSFAQKRWLHCDACEEMCDKPLIYECGWGKKLTYVIAYSHEEIQDVTWRYSCDHKTVLSRRKLCNETELINVLIKMRNERQANLSTSRRDYLTKRTVLELTDMMLERKPTLLDKMGRTSGDLLWRLSRGETEDNTKTAHTWIISDSDTNHGDVTVRYSTSMDLYEYVLGNGVINFKLNRWQQGVFTSRDVFRKEEKDWKMVYLARNDFADEGHIGWKFLLDSSKKIIDKIQLHCIQQTYENGKVDISLLCNNKTIPISNSETTVNADCNSIELNVSISGGKGDVAWQHAQLFRQSSTSMDYTFSITFSFKDKKSDNK